MTSSLTDIREALKVTVGQAGLNVYSTVPDVTNSPACVVEPAMADYTSAMGMGGDTYKFDLMVLVAATDMRNAQQILDQYITGQGPKSIREFLFRNPGLGLSDVDCIAEGFKGYNGSPKVAGFEMIGAVMRVCVTVT